MPGQGQESCELGLRLVGWVLKIVTTSIGSALLRFTVYIDRTTDTNGLSRTLPESNCIFVLYQLPKGCADPCLPAVPLE